MIEKEKLKEIIKKRDMLIEKLKNEIKSFNDYVESFACENFDEFQDFISTFMLTPHEEQTLIRELENKNKQNKKQIKILKKALSLACEDLSLYEDFTTAEFKAKCYIQQAKENLDGGGDIKC